MWTMCSRSGRSLEVDQAGVQPLVVRVLGRELGLDLVVLDDPVLVGVDQEHPARLEPALAGDRGGVEVEDADLGGEHHQAVVGDPVARGTQPVAVEHGADLGAVGEHHARRAVPRLHQRGVELVERPGPGVHLAARTVVLARGGVLPGLRDHHQHRVRQRPAAEVEQLEDLVERGRVGRPGGADRVEPVEVAGDQVGVEQRLARPHPVAVAHDGVDLAVVGDEPERVGQRPARERVGREPRVDHGQRRGHPLVDQVGVEVVELLGGEHALVDQGARRERREVRVGLVLDPLPQAVGLPLQGHAADAGAGTCEEELGEGRHRAAGGRAQHVVLGRDVAPAQDREVLLGGELLDATAGLGDRVGVARAGTRCRRRTTRGRAGRSRRRRAGTRRAPAAGSRRRHRSWARRRRRRGGRGCAARCGPWPRCRGWPRPSASRRRRHRRRRARGAGRRGPGRVGNACDTAFSRRLLIGAPGARCAECVGSD